MLELTVEPVPLDMCCRRQITWPPIDLLTPEPVVQDRVAHASHPLKLRYPAAIYITGEWHPHRLDVWLCEDRQIVYYRWSNKPRNPRLAWRLVYYVAHDIRKDFPNWPWRFAKDRTSRKR